MKRDHFGSFAATTANAGAEILAENARWDIWLATGVLPRLGDCYVHEHSQFPATPSELLLASHRETHASALATEEAALAPALLVDIHHRMGALREEYETFPEEAMMPLWIANTFVHPAIDTADPLMTVLLAYAGCDGLLLNRKDDDSRFGPRLALLVARDKAEERTLRRVAAKWTELRGSAAHGQRPEIGAVATFVGQEVVADDSVRSFLGPDSIRQEARARASKMLRRVFLAMLFCCVVIDDHGLLRLGLPRNSVLELLERAASGDTAARKEIATKVPDFIRGMGV